MKSRKPVVVDLFCGAGGERQGREVRSGNIAKTAREMGVAESTIKRRLRDGNWIHRDGYVPVRVQGMKVSSEYGIERKDMPRMLAAKG